MNLYLLVKERSEEQWIKQDFPLMPELVICAECDLIVEVTHKCHFSLSFSNQQKLVVFISLIQLRKQNARINASKTSENCLMWHLSQT